MIQVSNVVKSFDGFKVLNGLSMTVKKGLIYGLVGKNGAGKTTIIKHVTGILRQDEGRIAIDGEDVFDNIQIKKKMGFIPDDLYFFATYNITEMAKFYKEIYPGWNDERFSGMVSEFGLDKKRRLSKFSKGMQKQAAFVLTMSTTPEYLILDEPIDGIDPIIRKLVWKYILNDAAERKMSVLVSSHNLRELEGICDSIGIISNGVIVLERDIDEFKSDIHKVQVAFKDNSVPKDPYTGLKILHMEQRGSVDLLIIRNKMEVVENIISANNPAIFDILPLSLEEIFIYEPGDEYNEINGIF